MKKILKNLIDTLADAALMEAGVNAAPSAPKAGPVHESLEERLIEVAFAEAADYDDIHKAILREHRPDRDIVRPDECQYGDNDVCFV